MSQRLAEEIRRRATERAIRRAVLGQASVTPPDAGQDEAVGTVVDGELVLFGRLDITPLTDAPEEEGGFVLA